MKEVIIKYFGDKIDSHEIVEEVGELIRCKDCANYRHYECPVEATGRPAPDMWCAWAERGE